MNTGDFINPPSGHPEVDENPELMTPATEATKQTLLDLITDKTKDCGEADIWKARTFKRKYYDNQTVFVARFKEKASPDDPNRVGQVTLNEKLPGKDTFLTHYFLADSSDGLQIKRVHRTMPPMLPRGASSKEIREASIAGIARIRADREGDIADNELGLSFVSEAEAKTIIAVVQEL